MYMENCFHCGDPCVDGVITHQNEAFCCHGCKTVFEILHDHDLSYYYDLDTSPGTAPTAAAEKFDYLDDQTIVDKLLSFNEQGTQVVSFLIPSIHCSSCIWILENLNKLHSAIQSSTVNFPEKTVRIVFSSEEYTLKNLVVLLNKIGYEPNISLENLTSKRSKPDRSLLYKLGVAGFAFGNIMFLSFPEYFEVNEFWLERFKYVFRWLIFIFSLPVVFYSARDYFTSAIKGLRHKSLTIDVPIAIGIATLFIRSSMDIMMDWGTGFFDSMAGLVFFLLLGRFFQQKTYKYLSFERDYKSYFPIAVSRLDRNTSIPKEIQTQVSELKKGDRIMIRNQELIPVDAVLIKGNALIDYSFVSGEEEPVFKVSGDQLFAGGKQQCGVIELEVLKPIEQSYLTQLWSNEVFNKNQTSDFESLTDSISKKFTAIILLIASLATLFWVFYQPSEAVNIFTAVLIVACPCAIALAAPFTLGNLLRIFGRHKFYVKNSSTVEQLAAIDTVVFDKTGTLTVHTKNVISYEGITLTEAEKTLLNSTLRASTHPLSRALYTMLDSHQIKPLDEFHEEAGKGISAVLEQEYIKIGSSAFVGGRDVNDTATSLEDVPKRTAVHISTQNGYRGCYVFCNTYREGMKKVFDELSSDAEVHILSGDNEGEMPYLKSLLPKDADLKFNQSPQDKLDYIKTLQDQGRKVLMIGDGLNDSGALAQSNVGVVISDNTNTFSPASDGILDASRFAELATFLKLSKQGIRVIKWAFLFSLGYNVIGLGFAVTGNLAPVVAAILMPLSSISIVIFTTVATQLLGKKLK